MKHRCDKFKFATGIENSYPTISLADGSDFRVDEMQKAFHYQYWKEDFNLLKETGIEFLRYGAPYYSTHTGPGCYDWSFADETFGALQKLSIIPIADLCHFGVPDWIGNFQNKEWPHLFAEYAKAFTKRFPHIKYYTPVNEIYIAASFSAKYGWWNERLSDDRAFVTAINNLCKANLLAMQAIRKENPDAIFIQSESSEYFHAEYPNDCCLERADFLNEQRFISLDFIYGHLVSSKMYNYLIDNGMSRQEYEWFMNHAIKYRCIMGNDYYASNEHWVHHDGNISSCGEIFGYYAITHQYFNRYRLPIMHTETNSNGSGAEIWLKKQWANAYRLKQDGVPLVGFTWYSLTDQVDWDSSLRENKGNINDLGLYDLDRKIRPVGETYKKIITAWKQILDFDCCNF